MKCTLIYGPHNVVTPRRFLPTSEGMFRLDHGPTCGLESDFAEELSRKLSNSPKVDHKIILAEKEDATGAVSAHYSSQDAMEIIVNIYAPSFLNEFCTGEFRQEVLTAKTTQIDWIAREVKKVRAAV